MNKNKGGREIKSIPISINTENKVEKEKYIKTKEKNNQLVQLLDELNKMDNDKNNKTKDKDDKDDQNQLIKKLKEMYLNIDKNNLMEIVNEDDNEEKEMIEFIDDYMNMLTQ